MRQFLYRFIDYGFEYTYVYNIFIYGVTTRIAKCPTNCTYSVRYKSVLETICTFLWSALNIETIQYNK